MSVWRMEPWPGNGGGISDLRTRTSFQEYSSGVGPKPIDRLFQLAYRGAYQLMRINWALRHPATHGALVAIWNQGEILLVKNSYVPYYSLPGGYVRQGETGQAAAARELIEEVKLHVGPDQLKLALSKHHIWEGKREHIEIFELTTELRPQLQVDHREVLEAKFMAPREALKLPLFPPIGEVISLWMGRNG